MVEVNPNPVIDWTKQPVEFWSNSTYLVCAYRDQCNEIGLIAIRRRDWQPCADWRDKQAIKNEILGPEWEAAELYPAESRLQDTANWYWLSVMPKGERFPWGFAQGVNLRDKATKKEVQRPLSERGDDSPLVQAKPFIAMPCYRDVPLEVVLALLRVKELPCPYAIHLTPGDSLVSRARNRIAADFLESDCTHLLFIDSDIVFEPADIIRLLSHDLPIVSGLYSIKGAPGFWCCDVALNHGPSGLLEVRRTGTGFLAIKREVFQKMIEALGPEIEYEAYDCEGGRREHDFFPVGVHYEKDNDIRRYYSEDWYFCEKARELGFPVYVDPEIALKHIGPAAYPLGPEDLTLTNESI